MSPKPVCLVLECVPRSLLALDVQAEVDATGLAHGEHNIALEVVTGAQVQKLKKAARDHDPVILHFSGHAGHAGGAAGAAYASRAELKEDKKGVLFVETTKHAVAELHAKDLHDLLGGDAPSIAVLVLNACHSESFAREFLELRESVRFVVGTTAEVTDDEAKQFSRLFYQDLNRHKSLGEAFRAARVGAKIESGAESYVMLEKVEGTADAYVVVPRLDPGATALPEPTEPVPPADRTPPERPAAEPGEAPLPRWLPIVAFLAGLVLLPAAIGLAITNPCPSSFAAWTFTLVFALGAAAFALALTGFLRVKYEMPGLAIVAGGPFAIFVLVFVVRPPAVGADCGGAGAGGDGGGGGTTSSSTATSSGSTSTGTRAARAIRNCAPAKVAAQDGGAGVHSIAPGGTADIDGAGWSVDGVMLEDGPPHATVWRVDFDGDGAEVSSIVASYDSEPKPLEIEMPSWDSEPSALQIELTPGPGCAKPALRLVAPGGKLDLPSSPSKLERCAASQVSDLLGSSWKLGAPTVGYTDWTRHDAVFLPPFAGKDVTITHPDGGTRVICRSRSPCNLSKPITTTTSGTIPTTVRMCPAAH